MSTAATEIRTVVVEREVAYPPEKIWRALTQPHLIEEWLMKNNFKPVVGHQFDLSAEWGSVDCKVLAVEPHKTLTYSWDAMGLESVVTWTLTPTSAGTQLRMEQQGFRPDQEQPTAVPPLAGRSSSETWNRSWPAPTKAHRPALRGDRP